MMLKQLTVLLLGAGLILSAGCNGSSAGGAAEAAQATISAYGTQQVTIKVGSGMDYKPAAIVVRAGQPVELTLRNDGQMQHDFALAEGVAEPVKIVTAGGQTASGTFTFDKAGTYSFVCTEPGHALMGMKGTITAQ